MTLSVALGLSTFVVIWLIQPAAQARGVPPAWFGPLWAGAHAWLAAVSLASARVVRALGVRATLLGCCLLVPLGYVGLAASTSAWGLGFYLCFMTIRGLQAPILTRIMQEHAPGEDRASVLSLAALLFRLAFVVVGPPVGLLVDRAGMPRGPRRARRRLHGRDARRARRLHPGAPRCLRCPRCGHPLAAEDLTGGMPGPRRTRTSPSASGCTTSDPRSGIRAVLTTSRHPPVPIARPSAVTHLPSTFSAPQHGYQGLMSRSIDKIPAPPTRTASAIAINARFIS